MMKSMRYVKRETSYYIRREPSDTVSMYRMAYFISKAKHKDIFKSGTGNSGTTNAFMNFGKAWGFLVLFCDVMKVFAAVKLCQSIFPTSSLAGVVAGCAAVVGHIFPFYMKFRGGKGIASFAGFIFALDWKLFIVLLAAGGIVALILNYGCGLSFTAAIMFPVLYAGEKHSIAAFLVLAVCSGAIIYRHMKNVRKIRAGMEMPVRTFLKKYFLGRG